MPKSRKQPKTTPTEQPQPDVLETPAESDVSIGLAAGAPSAPTLAAAALRPGIEVLFPPDGYNVPGTGAAGAVDVRVRVWRAAPDVQLGRVECNIAGQTIGFGAAPQAAQTWEVSKTIRIPQGTHQMTVFVFNRWDSGRSHRLIENVTYRGQPPEDKQPPSYTISAPSRVGSANGKATITISGTAQDASGVAMVEWSLDDKTYQPAVTTNRWAQWSFAFTSGDYGLHTFYMRFADTKGNRTAAVRQVQVVKPSRFDDVNDLISPHLYLKDLLDYARTHIQTPSGPLTVEALETVFFQPFGRLTDRFRETGRLPTNQVRLSIEVLRKYLAAREANQGRSAASAPVAHWTFDEGSGTTTADATGNGNAGTLQGPTWTTGRSGAALSFDGVNDYVQVSNPTALKMTSALSLCAWIYPQGPGGKPVEGGAIVCKEAEYEVARFVDGTIQWAFANSNPGWKWINTGYVAPLNQWTHIAVVYNNGSVTTYADGRQVHTYAGSGPIGSFNPAINDLRIGGRLQYGPQYFNGQMDDVRLYNYPLSASEVVAIVTPAPPPAKLVAHWTFDEGSGTTAADVLGNGTNGVLQGPTWTAGRFGAALSFDGVDDKIGLTDDTRLKNVTNNFAVAFWARPQATHEIDMENTSGTSGSTGQRYVIGPQLGASVYGSADHAGVGISVGTNGISVYEHSNDYLPALLVYEKSVSDWTHIAVVYQDRQPSLYVNGERVKTGLKSAKPFVHVCPDGVGGSSLGHFQGQLDDLRIYDHVLSEDALAALMTDYAFATAETRYRLAAYQALLNRLGTSYEEMRLARGPDPAMRARLAEKLGISPAAVEKLFLLPEQLSEKALEGLFGFADTTRDPLQEAPELALLTWRVEHLRALWKEQDWPTDPYTQKLLPIIDPDLIGPDDLRQPVPGQIPFDLWRARRAWIDARLQACMSLNKTVNNQVVPDLAAMFAAMYQEVTYADARVAAWANIKPVEFDQLRDDLQGSDADDRKLATSRIRDDLHLSVASFTQLLTIRDNAALAATDPRITVDPQEWQAVYAILVQAQKEALFPAWIAEEQARKITLDPKQFWGSQREPQAGDWPPMIPAGHPLIDPDILKPDDLAEPIAGKLASEVLEIRRLILSASAKALRRERETAGFEAMLKLALGHPRPGDPLQHDLDALQSALAGIDQPEKVALATQQITGDLLLTVESFNRLMHIRDSDAQGDPLKRPTVAEYAEVYALLAKPRKVKHEFPQWIAEERQAGLMYWNVFKARLPRWRASLEDRMQWQQALRARSHPPVIDPDLIGCDDITNPVDGNAAFDLWRKRTAWVQAAFVALKTAREQQAIPLDGFDAIVATTLGIPIADLLALAQQSRAGKDTGSARQQLDLSREAFDYLMRIRALLASVDQIVTEAEWANAYNILVQIQKSREFAAWRDAERASPLTFTVEYFQASDSAPELVPWRAAPEARQAWQSTLQARMDQEQTVEDGLRAAAAAAEEQALPVLRDALVTLIAAKQGTSVAAAQEQLSVQLAIDVRNTAAQQTTRVLQAIETIQGVLFSLRTGRFVSGHPADAWELAYLEQGKKTLVKDDHFDAEWKWMGSHATWASAIVAYYYLDILLLPSLRQKQSPAAAHLDPTAGFQKLLTDLNTSAQLTPQQVRALAGTYATTVRTTLPAALQSYTLTDQVSQEELARRGEVIRGVYATFKLGAPPNPHLSPSQVQELLYFVPLYLALQLQQAGEYVAALDWYQTIYAYNLLNRPNTAFDERKVYYGLELERNDAPGILERSDPHWLLKGLDLHALAVDRPNPYTRYTLLSLARCFMEFGDDEFTRDTFESVGRARALYENARKLLRLPELQPPPVSEMSDSIPPNPVQELLRQRVELQLEKIRQGRNIAGLKRQLDLETAPDALGALPMVVGGRLVAPGTTGLRPTPYRYRVLIERAKQLVQHAAQIEAGLLAAFEKADAESYNLLKARQDLRLAQGSVQVQHQRVREASEGVVLAQLQQKRAQIQVVGYQGLIAAGFHMLEQTALNAMEEAARLLGQSANASGKAIGALSAIIIEAGWSLTGGPSAKVSKSTSPQGDAFALAGQLSSLAAQQSTLAQMNLARASFERARMEWELQRRIAEQDVLIGQQQINVAQAQVGVARAELRVAQMQVENAEAVLNFLGTKFTNIELYNWMSGVLSGVYRYFLQQATTMAMLAQNQLAFERQQPTPGFILADYWRPPSQSGGSGADRRGMTGSARLLEDIYQLDQYAFKTDQRKLDLAQTFSLARLDPFAFQQLRESGVLRFATPMRLFDQGFPGQYLRLIKRVRVAVIALIPPVDGIRATLRTATGFSRVVIGGDAYKEVIIRRDPEMIALTAPSGASGVFELDAQPELLLPFEGMGVDALWEFELPKAANRFDYSTIADVLFIIEYSALHSYDYRDQVIKRLDPTVGAERPFSFRNELADQWYDLHNPNQSATPMAVRFSTRREDFPPNIEELRIDHITLYFARAAGATFEVEVKYLRFTPEGSGQTIGSGGTTADGVLGTRRGNAGSWLPMIGKTPAGEWELALANTEEVRQHFEDGQIEDILLVITYRGRRPAWPT
jgi:hypothetical protein